MLLLFEFCLQRRGKQASPEVCSELLWNTQLHWKHSCQLERKNWKSAFQLWNLQKLAKMGSCESWPVYPCHPVYQLWWQDLSQLMLVTSMSISSPSCSLWGGISPLIEMDASLGSEASGFSHTVVRSELESSMGPLLYGCNRTYPFYPYTVCFQAK